MSTGRGARPADRRAVLEAPGRTAFGRFGWKDQHASLVSLVDADKNEMGTTSPLDPVEPTSNGWSVVAYDSEPGGTAGDRRRGRGRGAVRLFMRATLAPPRDPVLAATPTRATAAISSTGSLRDPSYALDRHRPAGTPANGAPTRRRPRSATRSSSSSAISVGTRSAHGDGIVRYGGSATRNMVRMAPRGPRRAAASCTTV